MNLDGQQVWQALAPWLPDVEPSCGPVPEALPEPSAEGVLWQVSPGHFLLRVPGVARYLVEDGQRVTVDLLCDDRARIVGFLRMTPLAALLGQRGRLAWHAAAAVGEAGAVVVAGGSGSGKSALLAALVARGWGLLADDLVVLDDEARVLPTFGEVALWPDVAMALGLGGPTGGSRLSIDLSDRLGRQAAPLRAVVVLDRRGAEPARRLAGDEAFRALSVLAHNNHVAEAVLGPLPTLLATARLAGAAPVVVLPRPSGEMDLPALAERLEAVLHDG